MLAHDADLNDTVNYSLLGEHAHLFEINQHGQVSLRENIKQLNITSCQLTAQAMDSLAPPLHTHQARINLHVAASLVGRSINFEHLHQHQQQDQLDARLFGSRNLIDSRASSGDSNQAGSDWTSSYSSAGGSRQVGLREQQPANANQRSSVATVMSSLQHMVRSVNFFDMPFSSALLLSALLAFLICLLLIVVVSMSVHLYRRRSKIRQRQQLAAAAHLRHAHMTAAIHQPGEGRSRYLPSSGPPSGNNNCGSGSSSSPDSSPTNSTGAGNSPTNFLAIQQSAPTNRNLDAANRTNLSPLSPSRIVQQANKQQAANNSNPKCSELLTQQTGRTPAARTGQTGSRQSQVSNGATILQSPVPQLNTGTLSGRLDGGPPLSSLLSLNETRPPSKPPGAEISLISTLSSQRSKRSYRSNTTDDSSVMHCGHYSVNASQSPQQQLADSYTSDRRPGSRPNSCQQSVEAAIKNLVRAGSEDNELELTASNERLADIVKQKRRKSSSATSGSANNNLHYAQPSNELAVLTESKPGIKAYRKLGRPQNKVAPEVDRPTPSDGLVFSAGQAKGRADANPDSANASEASPSSAGQQQQQLQQQYEGLMAMIRDPDLRGSAASRGGGPTQAHQSERPFSPPSAIKWPQGAVPNRVKKLTWDDELSINNEDCFVAADIPALNTNCPMSPLSSNHQYPVRAIESNEDQYAEQHFLFSNTCSPAPLSADYTSFATAAGVVGAARATGGQQPSYRVLDAEQSSMLGQNNCFDYTIVQSSQFHVDAFASMERPPNSVSQGPPLPQSLSAQHHHLLQQQQQLQQQHQTSTADKQRLASNYLYSNSFGSAQQAAPPAKPDLTLITAAVL